MVRYYLWLNNSYVFVQKIIRDEGLRILLNFLFIHRKGNFKLQSPVTHSESSERSRQKQYVHNTVETNTAMKHSFDAKSIEHIQQTLQFAAEFHGLITDKYICV